MVLALGLIEAAEPFAPAAALATLFLRALLWAGVAPLVDSRRLRGREEGVDD
jgi:hypothetical protein